MNIRFASEIYINGNKLLEDGHAVEKSAGYRPGNSPQIGFFPYHGGDIEIVIRVANYDYADAGIPGPLFFGEQAAMLKNIKSAQPLNSAHLLSWLPFRSYSLSVTWGLLSTETGTIPCCCLV